MVNSVFSASSISTCVISFLCVFLFSVRNGFFFGFSLNKNRLFYICCASCSTVSLPTPHSSFFITSSSLYFPPPAFSPLYTPPTTIFRLFLFLLFFFVALALPASYAFSPFLLFFLLSHSFYPRLVI